MSKTITIPTYNNPFVVNINNKGYTFNGGATIEVPDEVAAAIENALALVPKPGRNVTRLGQLVEGTLSALTKSDLEGVESIANYAFYKCGQLRSVDLPDGVKEIGACGFYDCENLGVVRFGNGLANINVIAFEECTKLSQIYLPAKPPTLYDADVFKNISAGCVFYCKSQESLDEYMEAKHWSTLAGKYTFAVEE